jgi:hypothetical protein
MPAASKMRCHRNKIKRLLEVRSAREAADVGFVEEDP